MLKDVFQDIGCFIGMKPTDGRVALIPRHLLLGIHTRILLHTFHCHGQFPLSIYHTKHLLVTNGIEGIEMTLGIERTCFLQESVGHHLVHTSIDAREGLLLGFVMGMMASALTNTGSFHKGAS